jgi:hypothetical protein
MLRSVLVACALASCSNPKGFARAREIESLDQAVGGPKAIARPGDLLLENDHAKVAILGARDSLGPGLYGGSLVDADLQRMDPRYSAGRGKDQFTELFSTVNMNVPHPVEDSDDVSIVKDGSDGEAIVRVRGVADPFLTLLDALWTIVQAPDFYLWTDYVASKDHPWFTIRTSVTTGAGGDEPPPGSDIAYQDATFPLINWAIESGLVVGDFYLSGGSVDVFAPGIGFDEDGAIYRSMQAGENSFTAPFQFDFLAGTADGVSYGIAPKEGDLFVPLFTASQTVAVGGAQDGDGTPQRIQPTQTLTYERYFFIGDGDVASVLDQYLEARGIPYGTVHGNVLEEATEDPVSHVSVFAYRPGDEYPYSQFETDVSPDDHDPDGSFGGRLPVGTWELVAHQQGRAPSKRVTVEVKEGKDVGVALGLHRFGVLDFTVRDETGRLVPSKVTLFRDDGQEPTIDPALGDTFVAGAPEAVVFAMYGQGEVELPPGRYRAVASRGLEYEIDTSKPFEVGPTQGAQLDLQVVRSVESDGWVSADLHVHAEASHDSGVLMADRVRSMVSEGVEFFASTDHDYLVDYAPVVEDLGMEDWVQTAIGNETTTVEIGHFLAFPLGTDFLTEAGGGREGVDWTDKKPGDIIASLRTMGKSAGHDPFVFVGHPRDGILGYFDQYGMNPNAGTPGTAGEPGAVAVQSPLLSLTNPLLTPTNMTWDFDGIELLNAKRFELIRTPTQPEMDAFAAGTNDVYDFISRTKQEQTDLENGVYKLSADVQGHVDDWFTLLNLGYRYTALGNSDTHSMTSTEAGCPRNYIQTDEDDPAFLDDQAVADAVKAHKVVASYGPFVRMWVNGQGIGSDVVSDKPIELQLEVQAPTWIPVDRVELYENGALIEEYDVPETGDVLRFSKTLTLTPTKDSWYVAVAMGNGDLSPVFTPVEIPYVDLQQIVTDALGSVPAVANLIQPAPPWPKEFPIKPYAITNPIWVDLKGDGFDAPGLPLWVQNGHP